MTATKDIIVTLGPSSLNEAIVKKLDDSGVTFFRINCSHVSLENYQKTVELVQSWTNIPVCPDTEGAQLRTGEILNKNNELFFENHTIVNLLPSNENSKNKKSVSLNINNISEILNEGDILKLDFDSAVVQIIKCNNDEAQARVISPGVVRSNKGISCDRVLKIPAFSKKDLEIIKIAKKLNQKNIFLSFCSSGEDILFLRDKFNYDVNVISKIESKAALFSIDQICEQSNGVLIDRGDLSRDVPLEKITLAQKYIMDFGKKYSTPVFVATNLMESMLQNSKPTRAEVHDIVSTLEQGAQGLVLAAETAIGNYPVEAVRIMSRIIKENLGNDRIKTESKSSVDFLTMPPTGRIIEPHGGKLINQYCTIKDSSKMASLAISDELSTDVINICNGTFSPISKFMNLDEINSVLKNNLLNGVTWTMPIIFQINKKEVEAIKKENIIGLKNGHGSSIFSILHDIKIESGVDLNKIAIEWFGTSDLNHPGVQKFFQKGDCIISGRPELIKEVNNYGAPFQLSPKQTRDIFNHNGWHNIVGFHTRNIPHKGHEYIQKEALKKLNADAILISPVTGKKKQGDFKGDFILSCYNELIKSHNYDPYEVLLSAFNTYSRYAGPKEAVFTAICRKNYGCNSFIVGRDHTGVGNYFSEKASHSIFDKINIDMNIVKFDTVNFCKKRKIYTNFFDNEDSSHEKVVLSGSEIRKALLKNKKIPNYVLDANVYRFIVEKMKNNSSSIFES